MKSFASSGLPAALKRRWWTVVLLFAMTGGGTYLLFAATGHPGRAAHWGIVAAAPLLYLLGYTRLHLPLNRRQADGVMLPRLGLGNALTLLRGLLVGLLAGIVALPAPVGGWAFVPGALYTVASLTDLLDGRMARRRDEATQLGAKLDVEVDAVGVLVASVLAVKLGQLPAIFIAMGGFFYAFRLLLWRHRRCGRRVHPLPDDPWRSRIGGFLVGLLCVILWPVFSPPLTTSAGTVLALAVAGSFTRDALVATGRLDPRTRTYRRWAGKLRLGLLVCLPILLRLVVGITGGFVLTEWIVAPDASPLLRLLLGGGIGVGSIGVLLGAGGRSAALLLLAAGACSSLVLPEGPALHGLVTAALVLLLVGLGPVRFRMSWKLKRSGAGDADERTEG